MATARGQINRALEGFDPDQFDEDAKKRAEELFAPLNERADDLQDSIDNMKTFEEWQAEDPSRQTLDYGEQLEGLQGLVDQWQNGPSESQYDDAFQFAARTMGVDADQFAELMGGLTEQQGWTRDQFQGLTEEERTAISRTNRADLREMESRSRRLVQDSLADTGSTARMLQTANEFSQQINSAQLAQADQMWQANFEAQVMNMNRSKEAWGQMVEANQMGVDQYMDNLNEAASNTFSAYAAQIQATQAQNADVRAAWDAEKESMQAIIEANYNAINLEMGLVQAEIETWAALYQQRVQPYIDKLNIILAKEEATWGWDDLLDGVIDVGAAILGAGG